MRPNVIVRLSPFFPDVKMQCLLSSLEVGNLIAIGEVGAGRRAR